MLKQRALHLAVPSLLLAVCGCGGQSPGKPLPVVTVTASYPGANAQVVADTVAAPIEQQVNGVEGMVSLVSRSDNNGNYTLTVPFQPGTDLNIAQVLVQNRVTLAEPILPDVVKRGGLVVKRESPGLLLIVNLVSPDASRDVLFLSNLATIQIKDELVRLPGVNDVVLFGPQEYALHVWLDPAKLRAFDLTAADVVKALDKAKLQVQAGAIGRPPGQVEEVMQVPLTASGLVDAEKVEATVLKADNGQVVRLRDVARIELGAGRESRITFDGKPGVALGIYPHSGSRPREVSTTVQGKLSELRMRFPPGIDYHLAFDFTPNLEAPYGSTTPGYLLLDVVLLASASAERTDRVLEQCEALVRKSAGVQHTLTLSEHPFDRVRDRPCLLVQLAPADRAPEHREKLLGDIRARLREQVPEALVRLRDLSGPGHFPRCGYPVDLAVSGPEAEQVRKLADKLAERLGRDEQLTDVWANADSAPRPQLYLDVDREKCKALGVNLDDLFTTLQVCLGSVHVNDFNKFGRAWQVIVQAGEPFRDVEKIKELKVRNTQGEMVPLATVAAIRNTMGPAVVDRLNMEPMVEVTANPAAGVSPAQARRLCESAAEEGRKGLGLSAEYRLTWLAGMSAAK
jgi:multidrug efflux pump subunit AcrB